MRRSRLHGWEWALLIALVGAVFLGFLATRSTLWDRDEPRFARASVEMARSGNLLYPTFNGELRPDKPILIYWLQSSAIRVFGSSELVVRTWSILGAIVAALLTFLLARRMSGARVGQLAMIVLLSSPLMVVEGTAATVDAVLLSFLTLAGLLLYRSLGSRPSWWMVLPLGLTLAAAQLTKGPVGLVVPLLALPGIWLAARSERLVRRSHVLWFAAAAMLGVLIFLGWAIPANRATEGEFARMGIGYHVLERMQRPFEGHGGGSILGYLLGLAYYPLVLLLALFPWTFLLPAALAGVLRGHLDGRRGRAFVLGWSVPTFVLMSFIATKLPHYILPIFPVLAVAIAHSGVRSVRGDLDPVEKRWLNRGIWVFAPIAALLVAALLVGPAYLPVQDLRVPGLIVASVVGVGSALVLHANRSGQPVRTLTWLATLAIAFQISSGLLLLPRLEAAKPVPQLAEQIHAQLGDWEDATVRNLEWVSVGFDEPTLLYYLDPPRLRRLALHELLSWSQERLPGIAVVKREDLERLRSQHEAIALREIASVKGLNVGNSRQVELVALQRVGW